MRASDRAYAKLREDILHWRTPPGTVFAEVEQAERLKVSRTPIREAFSRLTAEGLLVPLAGRGLVVSELSRDMIVELFELRILLETEAARLVAIRREVEPFLELREKFETAAELIDRDDDLAEYYRLVARLDAAMDESVDSSFLLGAIKQLRPHLARVRGLARDNRKRLIDAAAEHLTIVEAIIDGDAELAADATSVHLRKSLKNILASIDSAAEPQPNHTRPNQNHSNK